MTLIVPVWVAWHCTAAGIEKILFKKAKCNSATIYNKKSRFTQQGLNLRPEPKKNRTKVQKTVTLKDDNPHSSDFTPQHWTSIYGGTL
ncbi:hypothetical protein [uncultured Endozoicomonas sp.]|uniref:hypothetical protein n=1 Tax=uncultured Endozoicomonas sp. TaxID=432652 RepID=UPI00260FF0B6|nr:hypothetical protein [uncultured Endozoicomonas sp.]